jgi:hypothetical protein
MLEAVSVGYCLTGWLGTAVVRTFGRDSLCYGLVLLALCWYFAFGRFVKDTPKSYQHDTNVSSLATRESLLVYERGTFVIARVDSEDVNYTR